MIASRPYTGGVTDRRVEVTSDVAPRDVVFDRCADRLIEATKSASQRGADRVSWPLFKQSSPDMYTVIRLFYRPIRRAC